MKPREFPKWNNLETALDGLDEKWIDIEFIYLGPERATLFLRIYENRPQKDTAPASILYCVHPKKSRLEIFEGRFLVKHTETGVLTLQRVN